MLHTISDIGHPELAWLIPVIVVVPFVSIVGLAFFLNWVGR